MRLDSLASKASISRKVSTWRSGSTRTCTGACGLMSLIATKPFALCTYAPSGAMLSNRQSSRCFGTDSLLRRGGGADANERPDGRVDEPRRVVVAVAAARRVDEARVLGAELAAPARNAQLVGERPQARAALPLHRGRYAVVVGGRGSRPRRVREDVHLREAGGLDGAQGLLERGVALGGEADDHVAREVELARERREATQIGGRGVAAAHCTQHAVVAGLERDVQVLADRPCLAQRRHERGAHVLDLDRAQPEPLEPLRLTRGAHEARQVVAGSAIAEAAEVDAGENDLAVALGDAPFDLCQHRIGAPAPRRAADERD